MSNILCRGYLLLAFTFALLANRCSSEQWGERSDKKCGNHVYMKEKIIDVKINTIYWILIFTGLTNFICRGFTHFCALNFSIWKNIRSRWSWCRIGRKKKQTSERKQEWVKRERRELNSCISRQTVEMKGRCLPTEDKPSLTAGRGSHLCRCLDDLLQCYRRTESKFTIQRRGRGVR